MRAVRGGHGALRAVLPGASVLLGTRTWLTEYQDGFPTAQELLKVTWRPTGFVTGALKLPSKNLGPTPP